MSLFDFLPEPPNIKFPTMGGEVFWDDLDSRGGYRLQQNKVTGHCRILDDNDERVAWGNEAEMRAEFRRLTSPRRGASAQFGDVICVSRMGGVYEHYGVYENDDRVYEYAADEGDFGDIAIRVSTFAKFLGDSRDCYALEFPDDYGRPGKVKLQTGQSIIGSIMAPLSKIKEMMKRCSYHVYSPEETVQRARSRLGETKYNLVTNNCEHFAIWCKTGISESRQVDDLLSIISGTKRSVLVSY